jgi:predicted Zn-dependent protease
MLRKGHFFLRTLILVFAATFLLASCAAPDPEKVAQQELAQELQVGRALAAAILARYPALQNGEWIARTEYLRSLGETLSRQVGRPELQHHFTWVESPEVNALAAPGGYIFLTRGLFEALESEDELVTVLLHEITHVTEKHVYQRIVPPKSSGLAFVLARALSGGRGDLGVAVSKSIQQGLKLLLEEGLGQDLERKADFEAVSISSHLGYPPEALEKLLARADQKARHEAKALPKTHPPMKERFQWLQNWIRTQNLSEQYDLQKSKIKPQALLARSQRFRRLKPTVGKL